MFLRVCFENEVGAPMKTLEYFEVEKIVVRTLKTEFHIHKGNVDLLELFKLAVLRFQLSDGRVESFMLQTGSAIVTDMIEFNLLSDVPVEASPGDKTAVLCYADSAVKLFNFMHPEST